jgi:hypothetical protein
MQRIKATLLVSFVTCFAIGIKCQSQQVSKSTIQSNSLISVVEDAVGSVDSPTIRAELNTRLISNLIKNKVPYKEISSRALGDLIAHQNEIEALDYKRLYNKLYLFTKDRDTSENLQKTLVKSKEEDLIEQNNIKQGTPYEFFHIAETLAQSAPEKLGEFLLNVIKVENSSSKVISAETLIYLQSFYFLPTVSIQTKKEFLLFILSKNSQNAVWNNSDDARWGYVLILTHLNDYKTILPDRYDQAQYILATLAAKLSPDVLSDINLANRLQSSSDPFNDLINEATTVSDPTKKNSLLGEAAQFALNQGKLEEAMDLALKVDYGGAQKKYWRDDMLLSIIRKSLEKGDIKLAEKANESIEIVNLRTSGYRAISSYFFKGKNTQQGLQKLDQALDWLKNLSDDKDKAFGISSSLSKS